MYTGFLLGEMKEWDDGWGYRMLKFYILHNSKVHFRGFTGNI